MFRSFFAAWNGRKKTIQFILRSESFEKTYAIHSIKVTKKIKDTKTGSRAASSNCCKNYYIHERLRCELDAEAIL